MLCAGVPQLTGHGRGPDRKGISTVRIPVYPLKQRGPAVAVDIYIPRGKIQGDLLVLPGWRYGRQRWYKETKLLQYLKKNGFRGVFPEMNISLYASRWFPETEKRIKWQSRPGGEWIRRVLVPHLQKSHRIFLKGGSNFLLGLSTGGRGVVLCALQNPGLFTAGAALSGDYNQAAMQNDRLMTRMYGPWKEYSSRWRTVDNPWYEAVRGRWKMPLYIGHGTRDRIVPLAQSRGFYLALKKHAPGVDVVYHEAKGAGHTFRYWGSELPRIFRFFNMQMK